MDGEDKMERNLKNYVGRRERKRKRSEEANTGMQGRTKKEGGGRYDEEDMDRQEKKLNEKKKLA